MAFIKYSSINPAPIKTVYKTDPNFVPPLDFDQTARAQINILYSFQTIKSLSEKTGRLAMIIDLNNLTPTQFIAKHNPTLL